MRSQRVRTRARKPNLLTILMCAIVASCGTDSPVGPPPPESLAELFGEQLLRANGTSVGIEEVEDKTLIAIYFAAQGCPACGQFTPLLVDAYHEIRQADRSFEVVLVSSDGSQEHMLAHMTDSSMPWLAVAWGSTEASGLGQRYGVRWIPTVIVVDGAGKTVSVDGRDEIAALGAGAYDQWLARSGGG